MVEIRKFKNEDLEQMAKIWNEVVEEGNAFPQEAFLDKESAEKFFDSQSACSVAVDTDSGNLLGLYILHPNNVGRCSHIANSSYAVKRGSRNEHIGEKLVLDSLKTAKELGFRILQFNAVVASNKNARHLYERLGFEKLGRIPGGFRLKDDTFEDIILYFYEL